MSGPARTVKAADVPLAAAAYVTIDLAAVLTGYTEKAIRRKIEDGLWMEGREYVRAPDARILISTSGYVRWAEAGR